MKTTKNTLDIIDFINDSIKNGTLKAKVSHEDNNEIIINNGEPNHCGVDITLNNQHAGGNWCVNDHTG